ncbi:MAG: hypothetical protein ISS52_02070 [Dehalococcoidia bacterium]|nr:hypothetical protein [Dehalococcoidia bacterium]
MASPDDLICEHTARYDSWVILALVGFFILQLVLLLIFAAAAADAAVFIWALAGVVAFYCLLCALVMPRRYQIYRDRLRIVFGRPLAWNIPLSTITEARSAPGSMVTKNLGPYWHWDYKGLNLATSSQSVVEIRREGGWGLLMSPADKDTFLNQLAEAIEHDRSSSGLLV